MHNHNKAQQRKTRVHISWDILYHGRVVTGTFHVNFSPLEAQKSDPY